MNKNLEVKKEIEVFNYLKFKEKSLEDIWREIDFFKCLKADEQKMELENLAEQVKGLKVEISANFRAIEKVERDLKSTEGKRESTGREYLEARERRQNAVALGEDDEKFKASITDLMVEQDRIEDQCIGLKRRIESLTVEGELLEQEKIEIEKRILRFRLVPLLDRFNEKAKRLVDDLKEIIILSDQLGEPFSEFRTGAKTVFYSQWEGIDIISKLYLAGEVADPKNKWPNGRLKDIFNIRYFYEELRQEREKVVVK